MATNDYWNWLHFYKGYEVRWCTGSMYVCVCSHPPANEKCSYELKYTNNKKRKEFEMYVLIDSMYVCMYVYECMYTVWKHKKGAVYTKG